MRGRKTTNRMLAWILSAAFVSANAVSGLAAPVLADTGTDPNGVVAESEAPESGSIGTSSTHDGTEEKTMSFSTNYKEVSGEDTDPLIYWGVEPTRSFDPSAALNCYEEYYFADLDYDTENYEIAEFQITVGSKTYTYNYGDPEVKATALKEAFGESFVITEEDEDSNYIKEDGFGLKGSAKDDISFHLVFAAKEEAPPEATEKTMTFSTNYKEVSGEDKNPLRYWNRETTVTFDPADAQNCEFRYWFNNLDYDSTKYILTEFKLTIGEKTLTYTFGKSERVDAAALQTCFGDSFVIPEGQEAKNFIENHESGSIRLVGSAKEDVTLYLGFAARRQLEFTPKTSPAGADVVVIDSKGVEITPVDGKYILTEGVTYNYAVYAEGYVRKFDTVTLRDSEEREIVLETGTSTPLLTCISASGIKPDKNFTVDSHEASIEFTHDMVSGRLASDFDSNLAKIWKNNATTTFNYLDNTGVKQTVSVQGTSYVALTNVLPTDGSEITVQVTVDMFGMEENYTLHIVQKTFLNKVAITDQDGQELKFTPTFNKKTAEYTLPIPESVKELNIEVTNPSVEYTQLMVNGTAFEGSSAKMNVSTDMTEIIVKLAKGSASQQEYKFAIDWKKVVAVTFKTSPEDAKVSVYNADNSLVLPDENGVYALLLNDSYTYTVTMNGYIGKSGTLTPQGDWAEEVKLEKAPESSYTDLEADYPGFRLTNDNLSVTNVKTPILKDSLEVKWEHQTGDYVSPTSGCTPIIVDGKTYVTSGNKIYVYSSETGDLLKSGDLAGSCGFNLVPPTYADGKLFMIIGLNKHNAVQCLNAETLESLWIYEDTSTNLSHNSPIRYDNGYLYVGFFSRGRSSFVCLSTADEDPSQKDERKVATWVNADLGSFKWSSAWSNENYVFVSNQGGSFYCLDKNTGAVVQQVATAGSSNSDTVYYNKRLYFTAGGYLYSYNLTEDGKLDLANTIEPFRVGANSSSTPAIYNNRFYLGSNAGQLFGVEGNAVVVGNIDPETGALSLAYAVPTSGYVQTSGLITTGYEEETGYIYVYFAENSAQGNIIMIKDKAGLTAAEPESGLFYTPVHPQYCLASVVCDSNGNLYFKNDSAWQWCMTFTDVYVENVEVTGGNAMVDGGSFAAGESHVITVDPGTESFDFRITASEGAEVLIDGISGNQKTVQIVNGAAEFEVRLQKGETVKNYYFQVTESPVLKELRVTDSDNKNMAGNLAMSPAFNPAVTEYTVGCSENASRAYLPVPTAMNSSDLVTVTAVSGVKDAEDGSVLTSSAHWSGWNVYTLPFADGANIAKININVATADGTASKDYRVVLYKGDSLPIITTDEGVISDRTDDSANLNLSVNKEGTLYYVIQSSEEAAPSEEAILASELKAEVKTGAVNTIPLTGLKKGAQTVYMMLKDSNGATSLVQKAEIEAIVLLGDLNGDGVINVLDVTALANQIAASDTAGLEEVGDINGDGTVNVLDVTALANQISGIEI
ncbi:outer membrane protein assembly factor BamB family protein [Lachnospiraceae bacterium LCP19S3_B12]